MPTVSIVLIVSLLNLDTVFNLYRTGVTNTMTFLTLSVIETGAVCLNGLQTQVMLRHYQFNY